MVENYLKIEGKTAMNYEHYPTIVVISIIHLDFTTIIVVVICY